MPAATPRAQQPAGDRLVAAANGIPGGASKPSRQAQARILEAMFSANTVDANKLKVKLMERLGQEFGLSPEDFETQASFVSAVSDALSQLKMQEGGSSILAVIEQKLGLDKLGVSLDQLVKALEDPESEDGQRLDAALRKQAAEEAEAHGRDAAHALLNLMQRDESGLYIL